ncbi:MAG TPA: hypothetical protein VF585_08805 [Chthoniobacterales bacterium]|jgi:uncharacterized protein YbaR (Trm112 family)
MDRAGLIQILRCPETMQPVREASSAELAECNRRLALGEIVSRAGNLRQAPVGAGLIREDGLLLYPVESGMPVMLVEEALVLG